MMKYLYFYFQWKGRAPPPHMFKPPKKELLRHIINLCYSHAIKEPEKLNIYEPFSPEVCIVIK